MKVAAAEGQVVKVREAQGWCHRSCLSAVQTGLRPLSQPPQTIPLEPTTTVTDIVR